MGILKMVRQTKGGRNNRKLGRKFVGTPGGKGKLRVVEEEGELYAVVTAIQGGSCAAVVCDDGVARICIMRKKFRGRGKRDNTVSRGSWVLVGRRDWESGLRNNCDLIEVYTRDEMVQLETMQGNWAALKAAVADDVGAGGGSSVYFVDDKTSQYLDILEQANADVAGAAEELGAAEPELGAAESGAGGERTQALAREVASVVADVDGWDDNVDFDDI